MEITITHVTVDVYPVSHKPIVVKFKWSLHSGLLHSHYIIYQSVKKGFMHSRWLPVAKIDGFSCDMCLHVETGKNFMWYIVAVDLHGREHGASNTVELSYHVPAVFLSLLKED